MVNLSKAQAIVLAAASRSELYADFDVYAGYWYQLGDKKANARTVDALEARRFICRGEDARLFSGRRRSTFSITPVGRAALQLGEKP